MFTENEIRRARIQRLENFLATKERGQIVRWEEIEDQTVLTREDHGNELRSIIEVVRRRVLRKRQIALMSVRGVGYELLQATDQVVQCTFNRNKRLIGQHNRKIKEVGSAPDDKLSLITKQLKQHAISESRSERRRLRKSVREIKTTMLELPPAH